MKNFRLILVFLFLIVMAVIICIICMNKETNQYLDGTLVNLEWSVGDYEA